MKKIITIILVGILIFSSLGYSYVSEATGGYWFNDVDNHWGKGSIYLLVEDGIIAGYPDNSFKPDNKITVAEFTTLVAKALDIPAKNSSGEWYQGIIDSVVEKDIIRQGEFTDYNKPITRGEIARIVIRALGEDQGTWETIFTDDSKIPEEIKGYVKRANEIGVIHGYPDNTFKHDGNATRAEAVTVIVNTMDIIARGIDSAPKTNEFIEPELVIFQNLGYQKGRYYFGIQVANIDDYTHEYLFKAECVNVPEVNKLLTWHMNKGAYYADLTKWRRKNEVTRFSDQVAVVYVGENDVKIGDEITYKITIKKGTIEKSYTITSTVIDVYGIWFENLDKS